MKLPGPLSERFQVVQVLGSGAQATVVRARQKDLDRSVILKLLDVGLDAGSEAAARARREAQVLADLHHPCIVQLLDYEVAPPVVSMAYPDDGGVALLGHPDHASWSQEERLRGLLADALSGLGAAHEAGILHRDMKPANLLVYPDGTVKLIDFGLALDAGETRRLTRTGLFLGTPLYASPEQVGGLALGPTSDLYSLGLVAYELAAGSHPHRAEELAAILHKQLAITPEPLATLRPDLPADLTALIDALIAKDPAERPASSQEALQWLEKVPAARSIPPGPAHTQPLPPPRAATSAASTVPASPEGSPRGVMVALVLLSGVAGFLLRGEPTTPPPPTPTAAPPAAFDAEAWSEGLRQDLALARTWFRSPDGGLVRSLDGVPPEGAAPFTTGLPYRLRQQYEEIPALRQALELLAGGLRPHLLDEASKAAIREAEAPLRDDGIVPPFGPLLDAGPVPEDVGRALPGGRWEKEYEDLAGARGEWVGAFCRFTDELRRELDRTDALLSGPPPEDDAPFRDLRFLYGVRHVLESSTRRPTHQLANMALAISEGRPDLIRLCMGSVAAYRKAMYAAIEAIQASPEDAPAVAVAALRLTDQMSAILDAATPQLPEELLGGRLPSHGAGALVRAYHFAEFAKRHHLATRLLERGDPAALAAAEGEATALLDGALELPPGGRGRHRYEYLVHRTRWDYPGRWISSSQRHVWFEEALAWLLRVDADSGIDILWRLIGELARVGRLPAYRARLATLRAQKDLLQKLARGLARQSEEVRGQVRVAFPDLAPSSPGGTLDSP